MRDAGVEAQLRGWSETEIEPTDIRAVRPAASIARNAEFGSAHRLVDQDADFLVHRPASVASARAMELGVY